jgi:hypothetical protein
MFKFKIRFISLGDQRYSDGTVVTGATVVPGVTYSSYTYKADGNMIGITGGSVNDAYTYDGDGNMVLEVENGVRTIKIGSFEVVLSTGAIPPLNNPATIFPFTIDGHDNLNTNRNTTIYTNVTWRSYYGGSAERIHPRSKERTGAGVGSPLGESDGVYYLIKDNLGSTTEVVNPNGTVVHTRYGPWGDTISSTGNLPTNNQYTPV